MAQRKRIVFPFYNTYFTSTAIIIYQVNIIRTLLLLPDAEKPLLVIWHTYKSPVAEISATGYPYLQYTNIKHWQFRAKKLLYYGLRAVGLGKLSGINAGIYCVFPAYPDAFLTNIAHKIYWKADFQENYYPQYFTKAEVDYNIKFFKSLSLASDTLLLSSQDAQKDLRQFYPAVSNPVHVYRFVSHINKNDLLPFAAIGHKYGLDVDVPYYIVCNQFWPHKNHLCVLRALAKLVDEQHAPFKIVFTGKTSTVRGGDAYFREFEAFIVANQLQSYVVITGFLDRNEQLGLLNNAIAVVQPTFFEGWSTVIEDAKALNQFVLASNIAVNKEQLNENVRFFDPADEVELATMLRHFAECPPEKTPYHYQDNVQAAVANLKQLFRL